MANRLVVAALAVCLTAAIVAQAQEARPAYKPLRFEEDWSAFDRASGDDFWDPIKHVDLADDGDVWASFGGSFRLRAESWQNFGFLDDPARDDTFLLGRALLHSDVHFGQHLRLFVEGESALATDRDLPGGRRTLDVDSADLQNAFFDYRLPFEDVSVTARIGRQELLFGKQRLVSPLPWSNSQRSWDAARLILEVERWRLDAFYSRFAATKKYEFNDWQPGPDFYGLYATRPIGDENLLTLDLYWLGLSSGAAAFNGSSGEEDRHTLGSRLAGPIGKSRFDFDVEGAVQVGEVGSADVLAWMFASEAGYTFPHEQLKPRVHLGFDYASGDDEATDGDVETFNQLFPLGHAYFGYMDFIGRQNIIDLSAGFSVVPHRKLTLRTTLHLFWRASTDDALYNAGGGVVRAGALSDESEVGQELDVVATYRVDSHLTLEGGYSHFFAGDFIEESGPGEDMDWFYVQAIYRF